MNLHMPPKNYYRIDEIALKWGCSKEDLLDYGEQGQLEICVRVMHDAESYTVEIDKHGREFPNWLYPKYLNGPYPLTKESIVSVKHSLPLKTVLPRKSEGEGGVEFWNLKEPLLVLPTSSALVITHDEKIRFEKEHGHIEEGVPLTKKQVGNRERGTWLKIIYLMAMKLAENNRKLISKGTLNANAFESLMKDIARDLDVVQKLEDEDKGELVHLITQGMSDSTLSKLFQEGRMIIDKYSE